MEINYRIGFARTSMQTRSGPYPPSLIDNLGRIELETGRVPTFLRVVFCEK